MTFCSCFSFFKFQLLVFCCFLVFLILGFCLSHNHRFLDFCFVLHNRVHQFQFFSYHFPLKHFLVFLVYVPDCQLCSKTRTWFSWSPFPVDFQSLLIPVHSVCMLTRQAKTLFISLLAQSLQVFFGRHFCQVYSVTHSLTRSTSSFS